ncbi:hypothetical protein [Virgisporangium ochraceum]|nr:hypothetical protein [Virgisporangium ochraceum]
MLTRSDVASLLERQSRAYGLLLWLGRACAEDPALLDPDAVAQLGHARSVPAWIARHRHRIPTDLLPPTVDGAFAALLASFLETSFRIDHVHFDGRLVATHLVRGVRPGRLPREGVATARTLAVKHLLSAESVVVTGEALRRITRRADLAEPLAVWTYAWELDRRARGKGKGPVVHALWRGLPPAVRADLTADRVWAARGRLLAAGLS